MSLLLEVRQMSGQPVPFTGQTRLESGTMTIGRGDDADLKIALPFVSRRHCAIAGNGAQFQIADQSSTGTTVNGQPLAGPAVLRHGDVIGIGDIRIGVRIEAQTATTTTAAPGRLNLDSWGARPAAPVAAPVAAGGAIDALCQAAGLPRGALALDDAALGAALGTILRAAIAGLGTVAQERARAHKDLGLTDPQPTNPVLAGGAPEAVLARLAAMPGTAAVDAIGAAAGAIAAHQRAALGAWQATFAATMDHFAPEAITARVSGDAAAWAAYTRAFAGREGYVETFAQEFAKAYKAASG